MDDDARKQRALAPADEAGRREALANEAYRRRAEAQPTLRRTNFSPARMLFVAPNSAPNSGRISPIETLAAPRVRIPLAPSLSPRCLAHQPLRTSTPCSTSARTISSMKKGLPWRSLEDSKYPLQGHAGSSPALGNQKNAVQAFLSRIILGGPTAHTLTTLAKVRSARRTA